jgi:ferredoxin hydrogenase
MERKIPTAMKLLGADYVFDILFGADLTIMEEATEFVNRIRRNGTLPLFTSCCPAWVKYCEIFYSQLIPNLSTAKSPISMQGTLTKTYFAEKMGIPSEDIVNIVVAPCTAKKSEINREELSFTAKDNDYVLTTREFGMLLKEEKVDLLSLEDGSFDSPLGLGTGAAAIFGNTGGVCEAALRTGYYMITGQDLKKEDLVFSSIRGMEDIKEASVTINGKVIKVAVCNGMKNAKVLIDKLLKNEVHYDFIEVMNCIGGCIAGGGQSKMTLLEKDNTKLNRMEVLYDEDETMKLRCSHDNPDIIAIYKEYLGYPNSERAEQLLHTHYIDKSYLLGGNQDAK